MSLIRQLYPRLAEPALSLVEQRFAAWRTHLAERKAQELPGRYPPDEWLAELVLDMVLQEQRGADDAVRKMV